MPTRLRDVMAALVGCCLVLAALAIIWASRLSVPRDLYVSEMGAPGEPTAGSFRLALLLIVAGGSLIAFAGRGVRSVPRMLATWTPAVSLWIACGFFLVASQITCTRGCPLPYGPSFTWQDLIHICCAVLAFAAAVWAMLQASFARDHRALAIFSRVSAVAVALIAGTGGILSIIRLAVGFGSWLEFLATTIAIAWVAVYGSVIAARAIAAPAARSKPIPAPESTSAEQRQQPIG